MRATTSRTGPGSMVATRFTDIWMISLKIQNDHHTYHSLLMILSPWPQKYPYEFEMVNLS